MFRDISIQFFINLSSFNNKSRSLDVKKFNVDLFIDLFIQYGIYSPVTVSSHESFGDILISSMRFAILHHNFALLCDITRGIKADLRRT